MTVSIWGSAALCSWFVGSAPAVAELSELCSLGCDCRASAQGFAGAGQEVGWDFSLALPLF